MDSQTKRNIGYPTLNQHQRAITRKQIKGWSDEVENRCVSVEEKRRIQGTYVRLHVRGIVFAVGNTKQTGQVKYNRSRMYSNGCENLLRIHFTRLVYKIFGNFAVTRLRQDSFVASEQWMIVLLVWFPRLLICLSQGRQGLISFRFLSFHVIIRLDSIVARLTSRRLFYLFDPAVFFFFAKEECTFSFLFILC